MLLHLEQMAQFVQGAPKKTVVAAAANDTHTLKAVFDGTNAGMVDYLLVGDPEQIRRSAETVGFAVDCSKIIPAQGEEAAAAEAVRLVRAGAGDFLMKGMMQTATLLKAVVNREQGLRGQGDMSHVALLDSPTHHKILCCTDGGMIPHPTLEQKAHILQNAVDLFHMLGYEEPKVAVLAASEVVNPKIPETTDAVELANWGKEGRFGRCLVEGPLSMDLATNAGACRIKQYQTPVAGEADILLVPCITAGNLISKTMVFFGGARMVGCVLGAKVPIALNSRAASAEEKYYALLLSAAACTQFHTQSCKEEPR